MNFAKSLADSQGLSNGVNGPPVNEEGLPIRDIREDVGHQEGDELKTRLTESTRQALPPSETMYNGSLDPETEAILAALELEEQEAEDQDKAGDELNAEDSDGSDHESERLLESSDEDDDHVKSSLQSLESPLEHVPNFAMKATGSKAKTVSFAPDVVDTEKDSRTTGPWANPANASSRPPMAPAKAVMSTDVKEKETTFAPVVESDWRSSDEELNKPMSRSDVMESDLLAKEIVQTYHRRKPNIEAAMQAQLELEEEKEKSDEPAKVCSSSRAAAHVSIIWLTDTQPKVSRFRARQLEKRKGADERVVPIEKPSVAGPRMSALGPGPVLSKEAREWLERVNAKDRVQPERFVPYNEELTIDQEALIRERIKIFE